jgi:hypothetical protein
VPCSVRGQATAKAAFRAIAAIAAMPKRRGNVRAGEQKNGICWLIETRRGSALQQILPFV